MSMLATPLRGGKFGVTMLVGLVGYDGINIMTSINFRVWRRVPDVLSFGVDGFDADLLGVTTTNNGR